MADTTAQPANTAPRNASVLPLGPAGDDNSLESWKERIDGAKEEVDARKKDWDANLARYKTEKGDDLEIEIVAPDDYADVEQKKAQLFYQSPQIILEPQLPGLEQATPLFEAVVNHYLGPKGVNSYAAVDEVLSDALIASGLFGLKIGYAAYVNGTKDVQLGQQPDPNWQPTPEQIAAAEQGLAPLQPPMVPVMATVPNIEKQEFIFKRISPVKLLIPAEFTGSDYDDAPWLGFEFLLPFHVAKRKYNLPDDFNTFADEDERRLGKSKKTPGKTKKVRCYEIYYKAYLYDAAVANPDRQRCLVIVEGLDRPAEHKDSPYQTVNPDGSIGGMPGFPIHVGALRYLPDSAFPPSDVWMTRYQSDEQNQGRTQMKWQRERATPRYLVDSSGGQELADKLNINKWQAFIFHDKTFVKDEELIRQIPLAHFPQENFEFANRTKRDRDAAWALGANPSGALTAPASTTATAAAYAQNNSATRLNKERVKFANWYARAAEKLGALIQMFADEPAFVNITGPDGGKVLTQYTKLNIPGKYAFTVKPNATAPVDAAQERAEFLDLYNRAINSPFIKGIELTRELFDKYDLDPAKFIQEPQPQGPSNPPKISLSLDEKLLTPNHPAFTLVLEILKTQGIAIPDEATLLAQFAAKLVASGMVPVSGALPATPEGPNPQGTSAGGPQSGTGEPVASLTPLQPVSKHGEDATGQRSGPRIGGMARVK